MPTNFWTWFWPSFWFSGWNNQQFGNNQLTAPTKQQKFPWLSDEQIKRLESISSDPQRQQELYKQAIQQLNSQNVKDNRIATENEMAYRNLNQKDVRQKNYTDSQIRLEQLADLTKEKYWLRQDAPTQEVVNWVIAMAQDKGVSLDEMNNYLDTWDQNFLYNIGLKVHPREKLKEKWKKNTWENMVAESFAPLDSADKAQYRFFRNIWNLDTKIDDYLAEHLPKSWVDKVLWDRTLEEFHKEKADIRETNKREIDDYIKLVNEANQKHREENVDQDIADYYSGKKYSELLKEWDWDGFFYKWLWDSASNWDMPLIIGATIVNPAMWTALMWTDSYVRENQEAYENMRNNWATHEQAEAWGAVVWLINAAVEVTLDRLLWWVETTASSAIRQRLTWEITQEAAKKWLWRIILEWVWTQVKSSAEEWLEEVVQQIVQNAAVKTINDNQELFEWLDQAFEWWAYNFMNILAWWSNVVTNVDANKNYIKQNAVNTINSTKDAFSNVSQWVDTAKGKLSDVIDQTYGIDETLRKDIQDNPYSAQVWERTKNYIEENGRPEKSNEVAKALITDVADRVQESLMDKMEEWKEAWKLYQPLLDAGYSVDISELKDWIDEMLEKYWIKVEGWKLNFDKTAIDGSEANNIRKIYNWIKSTDKPMSLDEYKNRFRKTMSDMVDFNQVGRDQAGRKTADTQWDKVLKWIRSFANDLAHNQIPELAAVDKQFNEWVQVMDEVSDGLVYKDKAKRWVIRDNISQIIKNLDTPNRRELANRLEKIMPWITEEVRAINKMPQLIDHYYKPSKWQERITTGAWWIIGTTVWWPVGWVVWIGAWYWLSKQIDKLKSSKWDKIISETSEDGKAKLNDIQARIENNERISQEQKAFLEEMSNKLKEWKADKEAEVAKIIAEVSSAEWDVETALNNAIARLETLWAKQEVKEMRQLLGQVQNQKAEDAQMEQARQEFESEKENIINESADQRLPEFKERIYKLQQEEKRIWSVAWKKIWKTFEGKDYKNQQETEWLRKKDKLIEEIWEFYNVDQQEASEIYDRIERTVSMDDLNTKKTRTKEDITKEYQDKARERFGIEWDSVPYELTQTDEYKALENDYRNELEGLDKNQASSKTATDTEYVNETPQDLDYQELADLENETNQDIDYEELAELENETAQRDARFEEDIEEENLKELEENENETPSWWLEEFETKSEIETLPADVSVEKEAKEAWPKRIAPDRVPRQQLTFDEWVNKITDNLNTVAEYMKLRSEFYTAGYYNDSEMKHRLNTLEKEVQQILYWKNWFNFQSTRSKEFNDLWKNITDNKNNPVALREVARNFYISKVKKDISKWYQFPIEVLEKIPWAKKALDARERYQKGLDTSFSAKDARIDYSEQDKIWAWIKSQDWKQVTKEQKEDIVKWIEDFGKTLWLDMKKFAKDRWLVYVHLHGWHPFLSTFWWMYREATNNQWEKNISVSVWGSENVRYKDPKTKEWKTNKLNTTMSHELGHAMDYLIDNRLFTWTQKSILRSKFNPVNRLREYYAKWNEIVARAIEQYVAVENWQPNYYLENWNLDAGEFKWTDLEYALKEVWSYYERPWYWSKVDYEKYVKPYVEEAFKNNFEEYKTAKE